MAMILIVYAEDQGPAAATADMIAGELLAAGHRVTVRPVDEAPDAWHFDGVIVGSDLHGRRSRWSRSAVAYLKAQAPDLAERPTFLFEQGEPGIRAATPRRVHQLASSIGTPPPTQFDVSADGYRSAVTAWAHSIATSLRSPVERRPPGHLASTEVGVT
jgi:hypothetical protein